MEDFDERLWVNEDEKIKIKVGVHDLGNAIVIGFMGRNGKRCAVSFRIPEEVIDRIKDKAEVYSNVEVNNGE